MRLIEGLGQLVSSAVAAARVRFEFLQAEHARLKDNCETLLARTTRTKDEIRTLRQELAARREGYIEVNGVHFRVMLGGVDATPRCMKCQSALTAFPPSSNELLVCLGCGYVARGVRPADAAKSAFELRKTMRRSRALSH